MRAISPEPEAPQARAGGDSDSNDESDGPETFRSKSKYGQTRDMAAQISASKINAEENDFSQGGGPR